MTKPQRAFSFSDFRPIFKKDVRNAANFLFTYVFGKTKLTECDFSTIYRRDEKKKNVRNLATYILMLVQKLFDSSVKYHDSKFDQTCPINGRK